MDIFSMRPGVDDSGMDDDALVDEEDWLAPGEMSVEPRWGEDVFTSGAAHAQSVDEIDDVTTRLRILAAAQYAGIAAVLRDARECPDPWCGPDPTLDPTWVDPRERPVSVIRAERRDMAVRAAAGDLATRTRLSETTIRTRAHTADTLRERCPRVWNGFLSGTVDERNAATAAGYAATLPEGASDAWEEYDTRLEQSAQVLAPGKFRIRARAARERVHRESIQTRHARAREDRAVWVTPELDGMATLTALLPADRAHAAYARLDHTARHLRDQDGETRTLAQLRADAFCDLLADGDTDTTRALPRADAVIAVTVPVLTLLGASDEPATLDGYGPIDPPRPDDWPGARHPGSGS